MIKKLKKMYGKFKKLSDLKKIGVVVVGYFF